MIRVPSWYKATANIGQHQIPVHKGVHKWPWRPRIDAGKGGWKVLKSLFSQHGQPFRLWIIARNSALARAATLAPIAMYQTALDLAASDRPIPKSWGNGLQQEGP